MIQIKKITLERIDGEIVEIEINNSNLETVVSNFEGIDKIYLENGDLYSEQFNSLNGFYIIVATKVIANKITPILDCEIDKLINN